MKIDYILYKSNKIRKSIEYKKWREYILKRDKNKCVLCGSKSKIEVDHIKPLALYPELAIDKNNGRTLCKRCHKKTDTFGSFSKFKGNSIHPLLAGDLHYKIKSLPTSIKLFEKEIGLSIFYNIQNKKWNVGYKFANIKFTINGDSIDEAVDNMFEKIRIVTFYREFPEKYFINKNFKKNK